MKLKYDGQLSNFAFNFNLRRYIQDFVPAHLLHSEARADAAAAGAGDLDIDDIMVGPEYAGFTFGIIGKSKMPSICREL